MHRRCVAMHYAKQQGTDIMAFEVDDDFFCRVIIDQLDLTDPIAHIPAKGSAVQQFDVNQMIV